MDDLKDRMMKMRNSKACMLSNEYIFMWSNHEIFFGSVESDKDVIEMKKISLSVSRKDEEAKFDLSTGRKIKKVAKNDKIVNVSSSGYKLKVNGEE